MTTITILPENPETATPSYRALAGDRETSGKTVGEALDAMTRELENPDAVTLVVLQQYKPDPFFSAQQQERLAELMARWRTCRAAGTTLPAEEQSELNALVEAETRAATARAAALANGLYP